MLCPTYTQQFWRLGAPVLLVHLYVTVPFESQVIRCIVTVCLFAPYAMVTCEMELFQNY